MDIVRRPDKDMASTYHWDDWKLDGDVLLCDMTS